MSVFFMRSRRISCAVLLMLGVFGLATAAAEDAIQPRPLDAKTYRQRCLMCHSAAVPEGIADWVVAGIVPKDAVASEAALAALRASNLWCWRRCALLVALISASS